MTRATWICLGRYGFPALPVTDTLIWLGPSAAGVTVTLTSPRPLGPPVLNGTVAFTGSVKLSRAVAVLTSTAVTASIAEAISASAATDQRNLRRVTVVWPVSGDEPFDEPFCEPLDGPLDEPLEKPLDECRDEPFIEPLDEPFDEPPAPLPWPGRPMRPGMLWPSLAPTLTRGRPAVTNSTRETGACDVGARSAAMRMRAT